jgi:outer membrane protein TolC
MKKILLISLFVNILVGSELLTLQESIDKTLLNHPDIKSFELKITYAKKSYDSAFSEYLPQINLQAEYNPIQTFAIPSNGSIRTEDENSWSSGVYMKQKIWDFKKTSSKIKSTKVDEDISKLSLKDQKALMVYKVKSLYMQMILQKSSIEVRQKDLESKKAYLKQANALVEQGLKTTADASRFLASVYKAENNLAIAEASYHKVKNTLSLYMDEKIDDKVMLEDELIKQDYSFGTDIVSNILDNNYQLKITSQNITKNNLLHKSAKASHYGSIDGYASFNHLDNLDDYDSKLVGVSIVIPIYTGGKTTSEEQKAQINTQISNSLRASKKLLLKEEIDALLIDIKRYNSTILAKKSEIDASSEAKKVLDARYNEGLTTYIEVLDASAVVLYAKLDLLQAYYSKSLSIQRIQYLQGKIR